MIADMSLSAIAKASGAKLKDNARFMSVSTDSRLLEKGDLFVALPGERFDSHTFVAQAYERGAIAAVVNHDVPVDMPMLIASDTRQVLGVIARENRRRFTGPVVAVTGSAGKTTCKNMVASILAQTGEGICTQGNLNNEIGVPQTLLRINADHQWAVIEMGASKPGDIAYLSQWAEPNVAIVTHAMAAHMEGFGDVVTVAKTKGELFAGLSTSGIAVVNLDTPFTEQWLAQVGDKKTITFSMRDVRADVVARDSCMLWQVPNKGITFTLCARDEMIDVMIPLLGMHNITNALAASCAALALDIDLATIRQGLATVRAEPGRLEVLPGKGSICLIDDSYNANPSAVKAAIDVLAASQSRTCLILGNMAELGERSAEFHHEMGCYAQQQGIDQVIAIGQWSGAIVAGFGQGASRFDRMSDLLSYCAQGIDADVVLVKGSRSAAMETVVDVLRANPEDTHSCYCG